jgi:hypothetical protein
LFSTLRVDYQTAVALVRYSYIDVLSFIYIYTIIKEYDRCYPYINEENKDKLIKDSLFIKLLYLFVYVIYIYIYIYILHVKTKIHLFGLGNYIRNFFFLKRSCNFINQETTNLEDATPRI